VDIGTCVMLDVILPKIAVKDRLVCGSDDLANRKRGVKL
jgi:hypothetical protein